VSYDYYYVKGNFNSADSLGEITKASARVIPKKMIQSYPCCEIKYLSIKTDETKMSDEKKPFWTFPSKRPEKACKRRRERLRKKK
jgi:transposase